MTTVTEMALYIFSVFYASLNISVQYLNSALLKVLWSLNGLLSGVVLVDITFFKAQTAVAARVRARLVLRTNKDIGLGHTRLM